MGLWLGWNEVSCTWAASVLGNFGSDVTVHEFLRFSGDASHKQTREMDGVVIITFISNEVRPQYAPYCLKVAGEQKMKLDAIASCREHAVIWLASHQLSESVSCGRRKRDMTLVRFNPSIDRRIVRSAARRPRPHRSH